MSDDNDDNDDYEVGYGKPPKEHRFKKKQSGNPDGSSKKARARRKAKNARPLSLDETILAEACRPIQIREGENIVSIPAMQAHMRALGVAGLKGSRIAMKDFLMFVQGAAQRHTAQVMEDARVALDYKDNYAKLTELRTAQGRPKPLPHADDVRIDRRKGTVDIVGPVSEDEREYLKRLLEARALIEREISGQQAEADEFSREGFEPDPVDLKYIADLKAMARQIDDRFDEMNWLPRLAGAEPKDSG